MRIDDGAMLDAAEQIDHAREHLDTEGQRQIANILGCTLECLDAELDTLAARAKARALKLRITAEVRDRARNGRYAFAHDRGRDFAAGIWVVDPAFMIDLVQEQLQDDGTAPRGRRPTSPAPGSTMTSSATPPRRTRRAGCRRGRARPKPRAAISGSGTTSAPD